MWKMPVHREEQSKREEAGKQRFRTRLDVHSSMFSFSCVLCIQTSILLLSCFCLEIGSWRNVACGKYHYVLKTRWFQNAGGKKWRYKSLVKLPYYIDKGGKEQRHRKVQGWMEISRQDPEQTNVPFSPSLMLTTLLWVSPHWGDEGRIFGFVFSIFVIDKHVFDFLIWSGRK